MYKHNKNLGISVGSRKIDLKKELFSMFGKKKTLEILSKTGPFKVYWTDKFQNTITLAIKAFKKLNLRKDLIKKIEVLIFVTESPIYNFPGNGVIFASYFNFKSNIRIYDLNSGCTGFVDALVLANKFKQKSLIICSETYSKHYKGFDRSTFPIFSDAATTFYYNKKIKLLKNISGFKRNSFKNLYSINNKVQMNGSNVFNFVTSDVIPTLTKFLKKNKLKKIKKLYIHQASQLVIDVFKKKFKEYNFEIPTNLKKYGNTNASTIPILLTRDIENNKVKKGDHVILCGFGVGLSYNIALIKINE